MQQTQPINLKKKLISSKKKRPKSRKKGRSRSRSKDRRGDISKTNSTGKSKRRYLTAQSKESKYNADQIS